jgi:competence protein ComEC
MLFPFFFLALSLIGGILFSSFLSPPLVTGIAPMVFCLICAWISHSSMRKTKISFVLTLMATFFLGSSLFTHQKSSFENNPLRKLKTEEYIDFQGRLYKSPSRGRDRDYLYLKVEKVITGNREQSASGNLRISVPHSQQTPVPIELHTHDRIEVSAKLSFYRGYRNFGPPGADQYIRTQNIHRRAFTKSPMLIHKLEDGKTTSFPRLISQIRRKLQHGIEHHFSDSRDSGLSVQGAVVEALLLGERGRMDPDISYGLQNSGIFHLFAISGAHIAILSFFLFSLFRFMRFPDRLNYVLLIFFLLLYASLVEGRPSVMRATIMALAFLIGKLIWRNVNLLNTLSISAFILLMLNPYNLFSLGFQLTFAATLSIILFYPKIIKYLPRLPLRISEILALSLTAQMAVLPFVALAFNRITFSSLILNFAAIPLVGLIMASGYIFLLTATMSTLLVGLLAKFIHFQVSLLIMTSHLLDAIPAVSYRIPTPSHFIVLGYFISLGLFLLPTRRKRQKLFTSICFAVFFGLLVTYPFPSRTHSLKMTFIDVGQGDSILVEFPGIKKMLIDGGGTPEDTYDIGDRVVSPFLWNKGIKKIHYLVLTHAHPDHLNGLKAVARNFKIGEFWEAFSPKDNLAYAELIRRLPSSSGRKRMFRGHRVNIDGVRVEVLNPPLGDPIVPDIHNDQSLVLRISYGQTAFLLTGDIGKNVEKELVRSPFTLQSDVLKSPHHGSDSSSSEEFLKAIAPQYVVLSVGAGNRYGLPDPIVIERYQGINAQIYRTDQMGAVEISTDGKELSICTASGSRQISGYR